MTAPRPAFTDEHPAWVYLGVLAAVAAFGIVMAVALGLAVIPWPEVIGISVWFAILCAVTAATMEERP